MKQIYIYIVLHWFWEGDSNLIGAYENSYATYNEAKKCANTLFEKRSILKIVDCDDTWNWWDEDGQYESPGIVQIIKKQLKMVD